MPQRLGTLPFWLLAFDERGRAVDPNALASYAPEIAAQNLTDLFIFSHGWNNDARMAKGLYEAFFKLVEAVLADASVQKKRQPKAGVAGVFWPSIKWPDAELADIIGGAAGVAAADSGRDLAEELKKVFVAPEQQRLVDDLVAMIADAPSDDDALREFKSKLDALMATTGALGDATAPDGLERAGVAAGDAGHEEIFDALADAEIDAGGSMDGGAAGAGDRFSRLWQGAKGALRVGTYWQMKERAGIVGRNGLGPLLWKIHQAAPQLRLHLLGHSFGARLVSYALAGLPDTATGPASPIKSLFLLQGAFSHFAFSDALPFDAARKGDLAGMARRVDGPLLTTHSLKDTAVGAAYPLASLVKRQDAAAADDHLYRWGAMGHDGAQAVDARSAPLGPLGTPYRFDKSRWLNLDGNAVIINGGPPSGAHGDIVHPHTAWAALAAADIVR